MSYYKKIELLPQNYPTKSGNYHTNIGIRYYDSFRSKFFNQEYKGQIKWYLQEVPIKTDEEIRELANNAALNAECTRYSIDIYNYSKGFIEGYKEAIK